jgi:predicted Fe-Mo cluster-binding NifX family protein
MNAYGSFSMTWSTRLIGALLAALLALAGASVGHAGGTRIAVAAEAAGADAPVSTIAARAPYILIFDAGDKLTESHPNPFATTAGDAGPPLAGWLSERQVGTFIAGNFGSKLSQAMKERNIHGVVASGPAVAAVKKVQQ